MEVKNQTKMVAGWTMGFQPDGRELIVVAVKGTYTIPSNREEPQLAEDQVPLIESDEFTGEPGYSATLYESDYAHRKPFCDVLLNGSAYAPGGRPAKRVQVSLEVGSMKKTFNIVGNREWKKSFFWMKPSSPKPFVQMPISYDQAYGGTDTDAKNQDRVESYLKNPIGTGYYPLTKRKALIGKALPNTEEVGKTVKKIKGKYTPMSFGPMSRNFADRIPFAGTYNQQWMDTCAPFWPADFDYRYFQASPLDQQIPYPSGGERIVLKNLTPQGITMFTLPHLNVPVLFVPFRENAKQGDAVIDTICIEPDLARFTMTWRISLAVRQSCFEIRHAVVGKTLNEWRREVRRATKTHYSGLNDLVRLRMRQKLKTAIN